MRRKDTLAPELLEALMRQVVAQCIDIERLAYLEDSLIESIVDTDGVDRDSVVKLVQDHLDRAWQELMFEFERIRTADCPDCGILANAPLALPYLGKPS